MKPRYYITLYGELRRGEIFRSWGRTYLRRLQVSCSFVQQVTSLIRYAPEPVVRTGLGATAPLALGYSVPLHSVA
jgi:hypothetical protein